MSQAPYFHEDSNAVRFWVLVDGSFVGASISKATLHYRFRPGAEGDDPLQTYTENSAAVDAVVRRRVAGGSREPVMVREYDLRDDVVRPPIA